MKIQKQIPVIMTLCVAAAVFCGCTSGGDKEYDELNARLDAHYSRIVLTVKNEFGEESVLTDEYTMQFVGDNVIVDYSVQRFNEVSLDFTASATATITIAGRAVIMGDSIIYTDGEQVELDAITAGTGLDFQARYFTNVELSESSFKADVTNPSGFMGSAVACTEMKASAAFSEGFSEIKITYLAQNGNRAEYLYSFTP